MHGIAAGLLEHSRFVFMQEFMVKLLWFLWELRGNWLQSISSGNLIWHKHSLHLTLLLRYWCGIPYVHVVNYLYLTFHCCSAWQPSHVHNPSLLKLVADYASQTKYLPLWWDIHVPWTTQNTDIVLLACIELAFAILCINGDEIESECVYLYLLAAIGK